MEGKTKRLGIICVGMVALGLLSFLIVKGRVRAQNPTIRADRLLSDKDAIVEYRLPSVSGEDVVMHVDYDATRKIIENIVFTLDRVREDGEYEFKVPTKEKETIVLKYVYRDGKIYHVSLDVDKDWENPQQGASGTFEVLSRGGYRIVFDFSWDPGSFPIVKMYPLEHPF